jgi:hypothetical protein
MAISRSARPERAACAISPAAHAGMKRRSRRAQHARRAFRCRTRVHAAGRERIGRQPPVRCSSRSHSPIPQSMTRQVFALARRGGRPLCRRWPGRKSLDPRYGKPPVRDPARRAFAVHENREGDMDLYERAAVPTHQSDRVSNPRAITFDAGNPPRGVRRASPGQSWARPRHPAVVRSRPDSLGASGEVAVARPIPRTADAIPTPTRRRVTGRAERSADPSCARTPAPRCGEPHRAPRHQHPPRSARPAAAAADRPIGAPA